MQIQRHPARRHPTRASLENRARDDARWLQAHAPAMYVEVVTCGYDTDFAPLGPQVTEKLGGLFEAFPRTGPIRVSLRVVNDQAGERVFEREIRSAADAFAERHGLGESPVVVQPLFYGRPGRWGRKGLALREGILSGLEAGADVLVYTNLNGKVHPVHVASAVRRLVERRGDVVVGTRAGAEGGRAFGAGHLGRAKSRVWAELVRAALPPLGGFQDPNAPLKAMGRAGAQALLDRARVEDCGFDAEWLLVWAEAGLRVGRVPIAWAQRRGSRPPFLAISSMVRDLRRVERAWQRGDLRGPVAR